LCDENVLAHCFSTMANSSDTIRSVRRCWTYYAHIIVEVLEALFEELLKGGISLEVCELCRSSASPSYKQKIQ
jgi:hypothetical protein